MAQSNIDIIIQAKDLSSKAFNSANQGLSGMSSAIENMQPAFATMAASGGAALAAMGAFAVKATKDYAEAERSARQLEYAVMNVSKGTKEQVTAITELSAAMQKKSGIDGDALNMGAAQLSTFGLQSKSVVDLTKSLADLTVNQVGVTATGDDYVQSANTIAKALKGQFGALERSGIRFTETQQKMIMYGTEAEKVAALQEGLNQNLRETTDTVANSLDGAMGRLNQSMGEVSEAIGKILAGAAGPLLDKLAGIATMVAEWISANPRLAATIGIVAASIASLVTVIGLIGLVLPSIIAGFTLLSGPVGVIAAVIGILAAGFIVFREQLGQILSYLNDIGVLDYFKGIWQEISTTFTTTLLPAFQRLWDTLVQLKPLFEIVAIIVGGVLLVNIMALAKGLTIAFQIFAAVFDIQTRIAKFLVDVFAPAFDFAAKSVEWLVGKITTLISKLKDLINTAKDIGGGVLSAIGSSIGKIFKVNDAVVAPGGNVISTHPDDYLIATKDPSSLAGGGGVVINLNGTIMTSRDQAQYFGDLLADEIKRIIRV